jgi:hypothetical protein
MRGDRKNAQVRHSVTVLRSGRQWWCSPSPVLELGQATGFPRSVLAHFGRLPPEYHASNTRHQADIKPLSLEYFPDINQERGVLVRFGARPSIMRQHIGVEQIHQRFIV